MLTVNKKAPLFSAANQNGDIINLKDYAGNKVALYFYPKDDTPGCTAQACNIRDNFTLLKKHGITVLGISVDDVKKHKKFETKFDLPFNLIADVEKTIVVAYGVWGEKTFMGRKYMGTNRVTFCIGTTGKIDAVIEKVDTLNHTQQILEAWGIVAPNATPVVTKKATVTKGASAAKKTIVTKKAAPAAKKPTIKKEAIATKSEPAKKATVVKKVSVKKASK